MTTNKKINLDKVKFFFEKNNNLNNEAFVRLEKITKNQLSPFEIVVFGKYNHGKSTFLNSWLKQDLFKTGDTRVTTETQSYTDKENNIKWTDTPGLGASDQDDDKANEALKEADIVLLVHDSVSGELDKKELDFIKNSSITSKGKIRLLLTKIDQNEENVFNILRVIENQVSNFNIKIFPISPIRYQKYINGGSEIWKERSGFGAIEIEIKEFISNRDLFRNIEVRNLCDELINQLNTVKNETENNIKGLDRQINTKKNDFYHAVENTLKHL